MEGWVELVPSCIWACPVAVEPLIIVSTLYLQVYLIGNFRSTVATCTYSYVFVDLIYTSKLVQDHGAAAGNS